MPAVIELEEDAPPVVRAIAGDLATCLDDPAFAEFTDRVRGVAAIRSADTPEAARITIAEGSLSISHGVASDADVVATVRLAGSGDRDSRIEGSERNPDLAEWVARVVDPPAPPWHEAADGFWAELSRAPGAPDGLRVVERAGGEERRFGNEAGSVCEIHGAADGLVTLFTGRVSAMEAAYDGTVSVRCSFPDLSTLTGAGFRIRYGGDANGA